MGNGVLSIVSMAGCRTLLDLVTLDEDLVTLDEERCIFVVAS
jgi:hypothetical protein